MLAVARDLVVASERRPPAEDVRLWSTYLMTGQMPSTAVVADPATLWERRTAPALLVLTIIFLAAYAAPIIWVGLPSEVRRWCDLVQLAIWGVFVVDYCTRLLISANRRRFFFTHLLDLVTVVIPLLRPLRLLRVFALVTVLTRRIAVHSRTARVTAYAISGAGVLWLVGGLAITDAERGSDGATIDSVADGWWWAGVTMSTVGYGDTYPTTGTGRVIAGGLMLAGVALVGVVTAAVASWFVGQFKDVEDALGQEFDEAGTALAEVSTKLDMLAAQVASLQSELAQQRASAAGPPPS